MHLDELVGGLSFGDINLKILKLGKSNEKKERAYGIEAKIRRIAYP